MFYHVPMGMRWSGDPPNLLARHCWVLDDELGRRPCPGLILEWRRTNAYDWVARVVYVPHPKSPRSIEAWFRESFVRTVSIADLKRSGWPTGRDTQLPRFPH